MCAMFSDAKRAKKDVLADIVSVKHECQTLIMDASMRKAILSESENDVKEDMQIIVKKLQQLLNAIYDNARFATSQVVNGETEKLNDEIIFLEDQHKSLEEMEEYVKDKTSNTNLKPLKVGKEKCEYTRERLVAYKSGISRKCAKFLLHPLLAQILEQMETFALGNTVVMPVMPTFDETNGNEENEYSDFQENVGQMRELSKDPLRTSFMRSNSSKLITLPGNKEKSVLSRRNSQVDIKGNRRDSTISRQNSKADVTVGNKQSNAQVKKSKLITRSKRNAVTIKEETNITEDDCEGQYRTVAGLRATLAARSKSAPFINLTSDKNSTFVDKKKEEKSSLNISYREVLETKKHANGCYITGIAALKNGSIVLCDTLHDSLQLYDPETKSVSEMNCPHPWGVAAVSDTAVAVSLHYEHKIILVQATTSLQRLNEKEITLKCNASLVYDIKFHEYRIYALCIESDIHILDLKGREYGKIKTGMPVNTLKYFGMNAEKEQVVVSGEKGVACMTFQGLPLWHFKPSNKAKLVPTGVLVYNGCIIVNDWETNALVEIYNDGEAQRTVFSGSVEKPMAICQAVSGDILFVSQGDYNLSQDKARMVKVLQVQVQERGK